MNLPRPGFAKWILVALGVLLLALLAGPAMIRAYWSRRSDNPVRRGVARATQLGCFSCHGNLGGSGIKDPGGKDLEVPAWSGGLYMMYVSSDKDIQRYILNGSVPKVEPPSDAPPGTPPPRAAVAMPSYKQKLRGSDLEDLTSAFKVLSGMVAPASDSPEAEGLKVAKEWGCFSCHGAGGSGGLANPGSFAGFIPGWYGPDFRDMVRDRGEFNGWVKNGIIPRLASNPVASHFLSRQQLQMPAYQNLSDADLDHLWAYARWLDTTEGGTRQAEAGHP